MSKLGAIRLPTLYCVVGTVERAAAPRLPLPPLPITSPPAASIVDHLLQPSYKTINAYRGPRRPVT